ncbi:MAG: LacI family transcriptional regulator [Candidatus Omnitrophica bacterium]|nr:LacI family transcriptional regulator [Candidatus Omnitrophota bacterium]
MIIELKQNPDIAMAEFRLKIDKYGSEPLYLQVRNALEREIAALTLTEETKLPPSSVIADKLGVSTLTVDLAMESLVAKGLLYRRPRLGTFIRPKSPQRVITLGLITFQKWYNPDLRACEEASLLFSDYVRGIKEEISLSGCKFKFYPVSQQHKGGLFREHDGQDLPDGFIVFEQATAEVTDEIEKSKRPYLILNPLLGEQPAENVVSANDEGGVYQGTVHLLDCGYRQVIFCASGQEERGRRKLAGYKRALAERKIPFNSSLALNECLVNESGWAVLQIVRKVGIPCGVMVVNDIRCHLIGETLLKAGYRIPEEVGLVSFDDTVVAGCNNPALTAISKPRYEMGRKSVEILVGLIKGELTPPIKCVLETKLVVRESTISKPVKDAKRRGEKNEENKGR